LRLAADCLASTPLKNTLSGTTIASTTVNVEECLDVLQKVQLLITDRGPEVIPDDSQGFPSITSMLDTRHS
jgi:hypothetical protein